MLCSCSGVYFSTVVSGSSSSVEITIPDQPKIRKILPVTSLIVLRKGKEGQDSEILWNIRLKSPSRIANSKIRQFTYGLTPEDFVEITAHKSLISGEDYQYDMRGQDGSKSHGCFTISKNRTVKNLNENECYN